MDKFLVSKIPDRTRSKIQTWIRSGAVLVNNSRRKTGYAMELNDLIEISVPDERDDNNNILPEPLKIDLLYEDDQVAVVNKPAGLVVHPGIGNLTGTLVNGLINHFKKLSDINGRVRPGIVHRLDKDTSGVILIAKTNDAHAKIAKQFADRKVKKQYTALVWGRWKTKIGEIDKPIARTKKDHTLYAVLENGKPSITGYKIEKEFRHITEMSFFPKTGRTHQIRVHAAHIGFPVFGDQKYGGGITKARGFLPEFSRFYDQELKLFKRNALHAKRLEIIHPSTKKPIIFEAPLPKEYLNLINSIESFNGE